MLLFSTLKKSSDQLAAKSISRRYMCKREDHRQRPGVYTPNYIFLEIKLLRGCWLLVLAL